MKSISPSQGLGKPRLTPGDRVSASAQGQGLPRRTGYPRGPIGLGVSCLIVVLGLGWGMAARGEDRAKPLPTHVCSPRMGDYNDRQAFIGFNDGSVQWCLNRAQCKGLDGMPETPSPIVAFSCEREQFVWVVRGDGQVFRCAGAIGRKACEQVRLQEP